MPIAEESASPVSDAEAQSLFSDLARARALVLAVSGGPDSTALMVLAARWRKNLARGPSLTAVTVDHGLRKESKTEARVVGDLARKLGIKHRTLSWRGAKPKTGLPRAAREARYRLLAAAARKEKATHIVTAHTRDDQAETVLIRMMRGSGLTGLAAMQKLLLLPGHSDLVLARPLLDVPKMRLIATLDAEKIVYADDPTNRDPNFTRARLRTLMPKLAEEGLDARRLALLARRLSRADAAIEAFADAGEDFMVLKSTARSVTLDWTKFNFTPDEVALRILGRAVAGVGDEGPVELAKLEALLGAIVAAQNTGKPFRRTLAGAVVTLVRGDESKITVERAPPRRTAAPKKGIKSLTKHRPGGAKAAKKR